MKKTKIISFNRFEITMSLEAIEECHHIGSCDIDLEYWQPRIDLSHIPDDKLIAELLGYGAWTLKELQDRKTNEERILWIAAGNYQDEEPSND